MRIVRQQPHIVFRSQPAKLRERCDIAIHAEHSIRRDQPGSVRRNEHIRQTRRIDVRVAAHFGAREARGVDQRCMIEAIFEDHVVTIGQRADHPEIRHVTGGKQQRAFGAGKVRQFFFEGVMRATVATDQVRGTGAHAVTFGTGVEGGKHAGVVRQSQIVVAAERQQGFVADAHLRPLRRFQHQAFTIKVLRTALRQFFFQRLHEKSSAMRRENSESDMGFRRGSGVDAFLTRYARSCCKLFIRHKCD